MKDILGSEYHDFNLVVALSNGRPCEGQYISRALKALIRKGDLPDVVFHSLRHTSTTYKLKLSRGDMKSVQGDTGHSQSRMVSDVYSHILDEDRKDNAIKFEKAFYNNEVVTAETNVVEKTYSSDTDKILELLNSTPELAKQLLSILQISSEITTAK